MIILRASIILIDQEAFSELLRPQFSLRTLLLVTALIAVGAKLWHGPYHVIETIDGVEHEYDYYRGFGWERVKHGVGIERRVVIFDEYPMPESSIRFYRQGQDTSNLVDLAGRDRLTFWTMKYNITGC